MKKIFLFFVFLFTLSTLYFVLSTSVRAEGEFLTDFEVSYTLDESGITNVKNKITLTNVFTNLYATSYSIILNSINPEKIIAYGGDGTNYKTEVTQKDGETLIKVEFPDKIVGKDKSRTFWVEYNERSFAVKTGEVWEISIPRLSENSPFDSYFVSLFVPEKLGQEAYISPDYRNKSQENGYFIYRFNKEDIEKSGVVAGFGEFQVFNFNLNYHLENPLGRTAVTEIAIPPDSSFQKVYYTNITPKPQDVYIDLDGNWIAKYELKARERVDVSASGFVQIFAGARPFPKPTDEILKVNLKPKKYWEVDDPNIYNLAQNLKTPKAIYDYVSKTLKYDYQRVRPNVERLGAVSALNSPQSAICMEFTDLFIAIARAAGIPAREVNGYAYTENPEIQPLSLVNDVLHAWPEYYDYQKGAWIPVDPTWGSTTGGVDYFNKLDLRHFAFVYHGTDSTKPYPAGSYKLGANPQKDVFVSFGTLPKIRNAEIEIKAKLEKWIPLISNRLDIEIYNQGPSAVYNITPNIFFDKSPVLNKEKIEVLLPFGRHKTVIDIPFSFLGAKTPDLVTVSVDGKEVKVKTYKDQVLIYNLLFLFLLFSAILVTVMIRLKKWKFPKKIF